MTIGKALGSLLLLLVALVAVPSSAAERAIPGASAQYARSFQDVTAAFYRWAYANPGYPAVPTSAEVLAHAFTPWAADGFELRFSQPSAGTVRICMLARLSTSTQLTAFQTASQRAQAQLSRSADCAADAGAQAKGGLPVLTAMARTIELSRIARPPVLPAEPAVGLAGTELLEFSISQPSVVVTVTNNSAMPLGLLDASVSDTRFTVGSDCQAAVLPTQSCQVQVLMAAGIDRKVISRLELKFSNGAVASVSLRGHP